tara:strand:- start:1008 stop:1286 length:279 start_codon:yes stop_codon:yes gene_type:complete
MEKTMPHVFKYTQVNTFESTGSDITPEAVEVYNEYVANGKITNFTKDSNNVCYLEFATSADCDEYMDRMSELGESSNSGSNRDQATQSRYDT